ncbi:hypothetical protein Goarm_005240, partial [Gossypium armourianum]|nr:hypothetical protein [Gossypium armourianum]
NDLERLQIDDAEEEAWSFPGESGAQKSAYDLCLVGCCLTASVVHFLAM